MLTLKSILSQDQEGDWFVTVDLKDAYFHIQVVQRHRKFLRFAFGGKAYQYKVLPFGLTLAPWTFTKCMDAALAPLRLQDLRILNYLDDWLILASSREQVIRQRDSLLLHLRALGLWLNGQKSVLTSAQQKIFFGSLSGLNLDAGQCGIQSCTARFKLGRHMSVGLCRRLLGLMAAASPVNPLGMLHMRPFLWWMKSLGIRPSWPSLLKVSGSCFHARLVWRDPSFILSVGVICHRQMITTDASLSGWGAVLEGRPAYGVWSGKYLNWHINNHLALVHFLLFLTHPHVIIRTNVAVVSHINRQGCSRSCTLNRHVRQLLLWAQDKFLSLRVVHVSGVLNIVAEFLRQKLRSGEWMLNRRTVDQIW